MDELFMTSSLPSDIENCSEVWTGNSSRNGIAVDWQYTDHVTNPTNRSTGVLFFDSSQYQCFFDRHERYEEQRHFMGKNKAIADGRARTY